MTTSGVQTQDFLMRLDKAKEYIEFAKIELGVASNLFDDREEPDPTKRIRNRLDALNKCKNWLDKAILQWA